MSLITLVVGLAVIGVLLYLFNVYVTMIDPTIKKIINAVVIIAVVLWLLEVFGILNLLSIPVPRLGGR